MEYEVKSQTYNNEGDVYVYSTRDENGKAHMIVVDPNSDEHFFILDGVSYRRVGEEQWDDDVDNPLVKVVDSADKVSTVHIVDTGWGRYGHTERIYHTEG